MVPSITYLPTDGQTTFYGNRAVKSSKNFTQISRMYYETFTVGGV